MISAKYIIRQILRGCIALLLCGIIFITVVYCILLKDPQMLVDDALADVEKRTGLQFSIGMVDVSLLPLPSVAISDVQITGPEIDLAAAWVSARPNFAQLLRGHFLPAKIMLLRPKIKLATQLALSNPARIISNLENADNGARKTPSDLVEELCASGCYIDVANGQGEISGAGDEHLLFYGLQCQADLSGNGEIDGSILLSSLRLNRGKECLFALEDFSITGETNPFKFFSETRALESAGIVTLAGVLKPTKFTLEFSGARQAWSAKAVVEGGLDLSGNYVPLAVGGRINKMSESSEIHFSGWEWQLDADSGRIDALLNLPENIRDFNLSGIALVRRGSLTQWLGFARNLSPGLQQALDNIYNATLEFNINAVGLQVPRIEASCTGSLFRGSGSVSDFARPVVALDLKTSRANLGVALPESLGKWPQAPVFPYPPLTPMPGEPLKPGETGIGYDIKLGAAKLLYGPLTIQNASVRIYPGKLDASGLEDVLLDARGALYGGAVNGRCILGADPSLPLSITASARNVNGAPLSRAMPVLPFRQGQYRGDINIMSRGKKLNVFLANLRGSVEVSGQKASLESTGAKNIFSALEAGVTVSSASLGKNSVGFDGKWKTEIKDADFTASGELEGKLWFGAEGVNFKNIPYNVKLKPHKPLGPVPSGLEITARGIASGDLEKLELSKASFSGGGLTANGNLRLDGLKSFQGALSAQTQNLQTILRNMGMKGINIPPAFRQLKLAADISGKQDIVKLSKIRGSLGQSSVGGNLELHMPGARPLIKFSLNVDKFDVANFLGSGKGNIKGARASQPNQDINLSLLRAFDARGDLRLANLAVWDLHIQNLRSPLQLENGKLTAGPATAQFYGAPMQSRVTADFNKGVSFNSVLAAHAFDIGALARDRKIASALTGTASIDAHVQASFAKSSQMPGALNGEWDFKIRNGSWQDRDKNGKSNGKPTYFDMVSASGSLAKGVMHSKNFKMQGPGMTVDGGGWLNLDNQKIECNFNVNMKGLPDFPLRLYGTLGNSKTSIGAGKMMINAIGGIATGFINILGGIAEGVWNVFR